MNYWVASHKGSGATFTGVVNSLYVCSVAEIIPLVTATYYQGKFSVFVWAEGTTSSTVRMAAAAAFTFLSQLMHDHLLVVVVMMGV